MLESGGEINKIKIHEFEPGNNGVVSTEEIKQGEIVIYVPHSVLIKKQDAEKSDIVQDLYRYGLAKPQDTKHDRLLLQLLIMEELKKQSTASKMQHYIQMVHTDWSNFPILFNEEDMLWLRGSPLASWTRSELQNERARFDFFG